jgi:phosphatidylserine decarboxylase
LQQGDEMGRFLLGSTVVLLWPQNTIDLNAVWQAGQGVRLGEKMGDAMGSAI